MATEYDWGLIEQGIVSKLLELVDEGFAQMVQPASYEEAADVAIKRFPAIIVMCIGIPVVDRTATRAGKVTPRVSVGFEVHHYTASGSPDSDTRAGLYKLCAKSRAKLIGHAPEGQVNNAALLFLAGEDRPQPFKPRGGGAALKMVTTYELFQLLS